ncbi:hypothetical protein ABZ023_18665 [Streptomyces sp. NPDC006367]|uniref:hypothetical protein n=1 Tax=unclassified Streptomyces TaxID=2593676 RepID=UPI0033A815A8
MGNESRRAYLHLATCPADQQPRLHALLTGRGFREAPAASMPPQLTDDSLYTCDTFPVGTDNAANSGEFAHTTMMRALIECAPGASWRFWSGIGYADGIQIMGELNLHHPFLGPFPGPHDSLDCDEDGRVCFSAAAVEGLLQRSAAGEAVDLASVTGAQWEALISQEARAQTASHLDT